MRKCTDCGTEVTEEQYWRYECPACDDETVMQKYSWRVIGYAISGTVYAHGRAQARVLAKKAAEVYGVNGVIDVKFTSTDTQP